MKEYQLTDKPGFVSSKIVFSLLIDLVEVMLHIEF